MKENEAIRAVTKTFINRWKHLLSIKDWDVQLRYTTLDADELGCCGVEPHHKSAMIMVDINQIKDKQELLEVIRHELMHIVHAHFNSYRQAVEKHLPPNVVTVSDEIFSIAAEDLVLKLEHLVNKLDINIKGRHDET